MAKLVVWTEDEARHNLARRLREAREARVKVEKAWKVNEQVVFNTRGAPLSGDLNFSIEQTLGLISDAPDQGSTPDLSINYLFKNWRYVHAQLSANPPSVIPRPTSSDADDRRKADAADRAVRYSMKQYSMQDKTDRTSAGTLLYGNGVMKINWNPEGGEINGFDELTGEIEAEGDISVTVPSIWNIFIDPDADCWEDVRYVFERLIVPYEEACYRFPDKKEVLQKFRSKGGDNREFSAESESSSLKHRKFDTVELWEYWEKGLPLNGMQGRYAVCALDGTLFKPVGLNPERFAPPARKSAKGEKQERLEVAQLPYFLFTDIDVPGNVWGKSFVEYGVTIQDTLNKLDSVTLDAAQAHGIPRMILNDGSEVADDSITNSPWDIIKVTGNKDPKFMDPMPLSSVMTDLMARYKTGIDDTAGVNESMFGQQSREQSGFSMQYATNQGNMIRFRLLNKYRAFVEDIYKTILKIMQKRWEIPRTILFLGKEKAFEAADIKGADLDGGYDLMTDYGASLSLDPTARREEMMTLMPLFKEAGVEPRMLLKMLKLNELSGAYDILELAADRQREVFEEMVLARTYIHPEELQDHKNMLSYAYMYVMTAEFKWLDSESKNLIRQHIKEREQLAAQGAASAGMAPAPTPGPEAPMTAAPSAMPAPGPTPIPAG